MPPGQLYRLAWVFYLLLAFGGVAWVGWREGTISLSLFVGEDWAVDVLLGSLSAALLLGFWWLAERLLPLARELTAMLTRRIGPLDRGEAVALALLSGFAEEFFFRGAVQGSWGLLWATLLFALLHTGREPALRLWTVFALLAGLLFGGLVLWRGTLLAPIVGHALVNAVSLLRLTSGHGPGPSAPEDEPASLVD